MKSSNFCSAIESSSINLHQTGAVPSLLKQSIPGGEAAWVCTLSIDVRTLVSSLERADRRVIADIYQAKLSPERIHWLEQFQVRAALVVPILLRADTSTTQLRRWGVLIAHQCQRPRHWSDEVVAFLNQLAGQLEIGIQQAELLTRLNQELVQRQLTEQNLHRQSLEQERLIQALAETTTTLKQRNQDLNSFVAIATDAILVRDLDNRLRFWNNGAERIYGWSAAEALGRDANTLFYPAPIVSKQHRLRYRLTPRRVARRIAKSYENRAQNHRSKPLDARAR